MTARRDPPVDRALAKAAGIAQRLAPGLHDLMAVEGLPPQVRRQLVAAVEEYDLLRFYLREATLALVIGQPLKDAKPTRLIKTKALKRKAKR